MINLTGAKGTLTAGGVTGTNSPRNDKDRLVNPDDITLHMDNTTPEEGSPSKLIPSAVGHFSDRVMDDEVDEQTQAAGVTNYHSKSKDLATRQQNSGVPAGTNLVELSSFANQTPNEALNGAEVAHESRNE